MNTSSQKSTTFSSMANKWREQDELKQKMDAYRKARTARERREILATVRVLRYRKVENDDVSEEEEEEDETVTNHAELYPPHGRRGMCSAPDSDGWRLVTRPIRKQQYELTEAQLAQKYRETFFEESMDASEVDVNGDLIERSQRREFY